MGGPLPDRERGVYGITVAAELVGMGAQTLRLYEARGLLEPARTDGGTRRYSANDLDRIRRIGDLLDAGLNLAGIAMVLDLEAQNTQLQADKEDQQWSTTTTSRATRSPKRASSNNEHPSTRPR
jgi:DNA-binding transcriptional MerR regulator